LDALLDAQVQDFFKLCWTHMSKSNPLRAWMQSVCRKPRRQPPPVTR
jgi:hypothetical protein